MKTTGELLEKLDCNGVTIKNGSRFIISQIYGTCYATKLAVDHSGIGQVNQHAGSGSHSLKSNTCFFFRPTKI